MNILVHTKKPTIGQSVKILQKMELKARQESEFEMNKADYEYIVDEDNNCTVPVSKAAKANVFVIKRPRNVLAGDENVNVPAAKRAKKKAEEKEKAANKNSRDAAENNEGMEEDDPARELEVPPAPERLLMPISGSTIDKTNGTQVPAMNLFNPLLMNMCMPFWLQQGFGQAQMQQPVQKPAQSPHNTRSKKK